MAAITCSDCGSTDIIVLIPMERTAIQDSDGAWTMNLVPEDLDEKATFVCQRCDNDWTDWFEAVS